MADKNLGQAILMGLGGMRFFDILRLQPCSRSILGRFSDPRTLTKCRACRQNQAFSTFALKGKMAPKNEARGPHFGGFCTRNATQRAPKWTPKILDKRFWEVFWACDFLHEKLHAKKRFFWRNSAPSAPDRRNARGQREVRRVNPPGVGSGMSSCRMCRYLARPPPFGCGG